MALTDQQRKFYENTLAVTKQEIADLDRQIEEELAKVKDRLAELQNAKKAARQMYDAACMRLGIAERSRGRGRGEAELPEALSSVPGAAPPGEAPAASPSLTSPTWPGSRRTKKPKAVRDDRGAELASPRVSGSSATAARRSSTPRSWSATSASARSAATTSASTRRPASQLLLDEHAAARALRRPSRPPIRSSSRTPSATPTA